VLKVNFIGKIINQGIPEFVIGRSAYTHDYRKNDFSPANAWQSGKKAAAAAIEAILTQIGLVGEGGKIADMVRIWEVFDCLISPESQQRTTFLARCQNKPPRIGYTLGIGCGG
jgi:hypothetical protein